MNKITLYESSSRDRLFICNRYLFGEFKYLYEVQRLEILFISRFLSLPSGLLGTHYCIDVRGWSEDYLVRDEPAWAAIYVPTLRIYKISTEIFMRRLSSLLRIEELYV